LDLSGRTGQSGRVKGIPGHILSGSPFKLEHDCIWLNVARYAACHRGDK
jgi:hypothetical protein